MKSKVIIGMIFTLLLTGIPYTVLRVIPVTTEMPIKVGVIGPMEWIQGQGMKEASILAAEEINDAGGVLGRELVIVTGDEGFEPSVGVASMEKLITVDDVDFVVGGFRTEIVFPMRDKAMDHQKIFIITGAATNELLDCFGSITYPPPCGHCVECDYDRYKYTFRTMPLNSTTLFAYTLLPFVRYYMINEVLGGGPDKKVKVGCLVENLAWNEVLWEYISIIPSYFTGAYGEIVYKARPSHTEDDFTTYLSEMRDQGVELIIHAFSGEAGLALIRQWAEMEIPAIPVGINVLSQESTMWADTEGKCEYEVFISSPPRADVSPKSLPFWDSYVERWGHAPIYTSWGTYDAVYTLAEAVERAGTIDSDAVVAELEETDRTSTIGRFKFTKYHDVYSPRMYTGVGEPPTGSFRWLTPEELGWPNTWALPMIVQWIDGERVPVYPFGFSWTRTLRLPPWMPSGQYCELTVASSPITGITFTIDGVSQTTPYTEWLLEGSYTLEMPQTHNGYAWSYWLEDGDSNRIKTILLQGTTWTAVYTPTPPPPIGMLAFDKELISWVKGSEPTDLKFDLTVNITDVTNLKTIVFSVEWDPNILNCTSYTPGDFMPTGMPEGTGWMIMWDKPAGKMKEAANQFMAGYGPVSVFKPSWGWVMILTFQYVGPTPTANSPVDTFINITKNLGAGMDTKWRDSLNAWHDFDYLVGDPYVHTCHFHYGSPFQHELAVTLDAPTFLEPGDSALLNATVFNGGLNNETNVQLFLLINGTVVDSATIPELVNGTSHTLSYLWTPTVEATHNVTAYAPPVPGENITANNLVSKMVPPYLPPSYTLTIHSAPTGVTFTADYVSHTTPWSQTYDKDASVSLGMPEIHTVEDTRYCWNQWSDGNTSRSRTVTMDTDITLTAQYTVLECQLTITSSPITGIPFTINGTLQTTPYTEWLPEGSYTLEMPETYNRYSWSHWLEDGDTNRTKAITLPGTTWTAVYPPPIGMLAFETELISWVKGSEPTDLKFDLKINITEVTDLKAMVLSVQWDPSILNCTLFTPGTFLPAGLPEAIGWLVIWDKPAGKMKEAANSFVRPYVPTSVFKPDWGWVITLQFEYTGPGPTVDSPIDTDIVIMKNATDWMNTLWRHQGYVNYDFDYLSDPYVHACHFHYEARLIPPVGGEATPIYIPMNNPETQTLWMWLTTIILSLVVTVAYIKYRKKQQTSSFLFLYTVGDSF